MTPGQAGTILIGEESPHMADVLALESEPYFEHWSVVRVLDGSTLDAKIHAARWNLFFLAGEVKAMFFGAIEAAKVRGTQAATMRRYVWMTLFLVVACVFNPVFPVPFSSYVSGIVSTFAVLLFFFSLELLQQKPRLSIVSITDRMPRKRKSL